MVCEGSGEVIRSSPTRSLKRQREIAAEHGYGLVDHSLVLYVRKKGRQLALQHLARMGGVWR